LCNLLFLSRFFSKIILLIFWRLHNFQLRTQVNINPSVQSVVFESFNDATHGSTVEPVNPGNGIQGSAIGQRIFPDKETGNDNLNRRTVLVKATLAISRPNIKVYFKNYDLDDPSADSPPVDPTGNAGNDNNEAPQAGTFNVIEPCMSDQNGISCLTDASGVATIEFTTTMQPGDNFAVAASTRPSYLNGVEVDGVNLKDTSSNSLPTGSAKRTEMLTVWRRLHIEVDSMGSVANNNVIGTFSSGGVIGRGDQALTVNVVTPLEEDRFENGRIVIGSRSFRIINSDPIATPPVKANTADTVFIRNTGLKFTISGGQSFTLYDDDDFNDNDGTTLDGDNLPSPGEDVDEPDSGLLTSNDVPCSNVYNTNNCNVFVSAYVRPVFDLAERPENIPFYSNVSSTSLASIRMSYFQNRVWQARTDFWTIYLLGAYQFERSVDADPDSEAPIFGFKDGPNANDGEGAVIFNELGRPNEYEDLNILNPVDWRTRPINRRFTVAHEVGHLFGGEHEDYRPGTMDAGVMADSLSRTSPLFTDTTINKIRGGTGIFYP
jgi:hypothetical protein